ncbi:MAG: hypothetical protein WCI47_00720, partial [bacterium]
RGYAQRDPLVEYKQEAFRMFNDLQNRIDAEIVHTFFKLKVELSPNPQEQVIETELTRAAKQAVGMASEVKTPKPVNKQQALREAERSGREKGAINRTRGPVLKKKAKKKKKRR